MATDAERKEFDRKAGGKQIHPVPEPPKLPTEIFSRPEQKAKVEDWNKKMDDWRKNIPGPSDSTEEATTEASSTTAPVPVKGDKGAPGVKGDKGDPGQPGSSGPPGPAAIGADIILVATEDIATFKVVTSTGKNADSANLAHLGRVIGISKVPIPNGFAGAVAQTGELTNAGWTWSGPGVVLFLNGTAISETAPGTGFVQKVGVAVNGNKMIVELGDPIML